MNLNEKYLIKLENTDEELRYFFPYLMNKINSKQDYLYPQFTKRRPDQELIIQPKLKNLTIKIYEDRNPSFDAYTIPMIQDSRDLISPDKRTALFFSIINKNSLKNFNAVAKDKENIIFNNPNNLQIAVWMSKGIIGSSLTESEKTAIILHEIGHWVEFEPLFQETIFQYYAPATFALLAVIKARTGELRADKFAARMGYSEEMEIVLKKTTRGVRSNISILGKISDYNNVIHSAIHSYLDKKRGSYTHPNIDERIRNIKNVEEQMKVFDHILFREEALNEDLSNFFYSTVKLLISPLDKLVAKHVNLLFPLSK